jgi:hypothetical protein
MKFQFLRSLFAVAVCLSYDPDKSFFCHVLGPFLRSPTSSFHSRRVVAVERNRTNVASASVSELQPPTSLLHLFPDTVKKKLMVGSDYSGASTSGLLCDGGPQIWLVGRFCRGCRFARCPHGHFFSQPTTFSKRLVSKQYMAERRPFPRSYTDESSSTLSLPTWKSATPLSYK